MAKLTTVLEPPVVEENKVEKPIKSRRTNKKGVVSNCELLNVRSEASLSSEVAKIIPVGTEVEILGSENDFYKINDGFVLKAYITI